VRHSSFRSAVSLLCDVSRKCDPRVVHGKYNLRYPQRGIEILLNQIHDALELGQTFERVKLSLDRTMISVAAAKALMVMIQAKGTVDEDVVKIPLDGG